MWIMARYLLAEGWNLPTRGYQVLPLALTHGAEPGAWDHLRALLDSENSITPELEQRAVTAGALATLAGLQELRQGVEAQSVIMVAVARAAGVSWADIGSAVGMTMQGAQQRYASAVADLHAIRSDDELQDWSHSIQPTSRRRRPT